MSERIQYHFWIDKSREREAGFKQLIILYGVNPMFEAECLFAYYSYPLFRIQASIPDIRKHLWQAISNKTFREVLKRGSHHAGSLNNLIELLEYGSDTLDDFLST